MVQWQKIFGTKQAFTVGTDWRWVEGESQEGAYSAIAGYEALLPGSTGFRSLAGQLNGLEKCPEPEAGKDYCYPLASVAAQLTVGKALVFSEDDVDNLEDQIFADFKKMNIPGDVHDPVAIILLLAQHPIAAIQFDTRGETNRKGLPYGPPSPLSSPSNGINHGQPRRPRGFSRPPHS